MGKCYFYIEILIIIKLPTFFVLILSYLLILKKKCNYPYHTE